MKKNILVQILFCVIVFSCGNNGGSSTNGVGSGDPKADGTQKMLDELIPAYKKDGDCKVLAPYVAYSGDDVSRKWKSSCDYKDSDDRRIVDRMCEKLASCILALKEYTFDSFETEKEREGEWLVWKMTFIDYNRGEKKRSFAFLKSESGEKPYLLGEID